MARRAHETTFEPERPWPWVSYEDPAFPLEPWEAMDDGDLADAAVRFAILYLSRSVEGMTTLRAAALVESAAVRVTADVVAEARTKRFSWGRIGAAFGVGRTAVQKRFGRWPTPDRMRMLESQYEGMLSYLQSAAMNPGSYEHEEEAQATRSLCLRRRRGYPTDPLDTYHKTVASERRGDDWF